MDFLTAGLGLAALAILAGFALRDRGAFWSRRSARQSVNEATDEAARDLGRALIIAGAVVGVVTLGALFVAPSDGAGSIAVALATLAVCAGVAVWLRVGSRQAAPARATTARSRASADASATPSSRRAAGCRAPARAGRPARMPAGAEVAAGVAAALEDAGEAVRQVAGGPIPARATSPTRPEPGLAPAGAPLLAPAATEEFDPAVALAERVDPTAEGAWVHPDPIDRQSLAKAERDRFAPPSSTLGGYAARPARLSGERLSSADLESDRDAAFALIPLFREHDAADDRASAFAPIADGWQGEERPLPWETPAAEEDFIVDPAVIAERFEALPPPIPFPRGMQRD